MSLQQTGGSQAPLASMRRHNSCSSTVRPTHWSSGELTVCLPGSGALAPAPCAQRQERSRQADCEVRLGQSADRTQWYTHPEESATQGRAALKSSLSGKECQTKDQELGADLKSRTSICDPGRSAAPVRNLEKWSDTTAVCVVSIRLRSHSVDTGNTCEGSSSNSRTPFAKQHAGLCMRLVLVGSSMAAGEPNVGRPRGQRWPGLRQGLTSVRYHPFTVCFLLVRFMFENTTTADRADNPHRYSTESREWSQVRHREETAVTGTAQRADSGHRYGTESRQLSQVRHREETAVTGTAQRADSAHRYGTESRQRSQADVTGLCKKSGLSVRQVERWFRRRRRMDQPGVLRKFTEACWRFFFYLLAFVGGLLAVYDKEWFYDTKEVWTGFPKQSMLESQYWYYILEMSFYCSLLLSVAFDIKRKDFREQIVHHCATLVLMSFSWCVNYIRVGTLVLLVHDASDVLLESAKLFNYAKWEKTCQSLFVLFAMVFMWTRLVIFPFWLIHCTWVYPPQHYPPFFGYYFFNAMLLVLQALHVFWAYLILRMVHKFVFGKLTKDERSDNEAEEELSPEDEEDEEETKEEGRYRGVVQQKGQNGCSELVPPPHTHCPSKTVY
ncbi:hypothetical protein WMY93_006879 [Mugilogobius chulae]|uniref:TLC domain-containing protein n=1 Tax=Mugilogobius chulae TaxID=88201 RepID=A0AAW0PVC1_9GOBI